VAVLLVLSSLTAAGAGGRHTLWLAALLAVLVDVVVLSVSSAASGGVPEEGRLRGHVAYGCCARRCFRRWRMPPPPSRLAPPRAPRP
jgi:hypothetical protein